MACASRTTGCSAGTTSSRSSSSRWPRMAGRSLSTEIPFRILDRDELGVALARSLAHLRCAPRGIGRLAVDRRPDSGPGRSRRPQSRAVRALRGATAGAARVVSPTRRRRPAASIAVGLLAGMALLVGAPLGAGPGAAVADAAGPSLTMIGAATYDVRPANRLVHVTVQLSVTNHLGDSVIARHTFSRTDVTVPPTARNATRDGRHEEGRRQRRQPDVGPAGPLGQPRRRAWVGPHDERQPGLRPARSGWRGRPADPGRAVAGDVPRVGLRLGRPGRLVGGRPLPGRLRRAGRVGPARASR